MTRRGLFAPLLGVLFGGAACAPLRLAGGGAGLEAAGLRYGDDPRQTIAVHAPPRGAGRPVLALFLGGPDRADRSRSRDAARALAARGFVVFLADMRTARGSGAPLVEDAAAATAWVGARAAEFGGDPARLGVLGVGAGAEAALMIALDRRYMAARGRPGLIRAAASWGRPPSEPARDPTLTRPEAYVRADAPPLRLAGGGEADRALAARLRAVGGQVELDAGSAAALDGMADFLHRALAPQIRG